jgi:Spx/MgsR family transcriptional regulator
MTGQTVYRLYGLKNCDSCRQARRALVARGVPWDFHDFRADGVDRDLIDAWADRLGSEALLNRRSRTWRNLDATDRAVSDDADLRALLVREPALIRRPLLTCPDGRILVGADALTMDA